MTQLNFDPLTCHWIRVWQHRQFKDGPHWIVDDCDCGRPDSAGHAETCSITPIYAELVKTFGRARLALSNLDEAAT